MQVVNLGGGAETNRFSRALRNVEVPETLWGVREAAKRTFCRSPSPETNLENYRPPDSPEMLFSVLSGNDLPSVLSIKPAILSYHTLV